MTTDPTATNPDADDRPAPTLSIVPAAADWDGWTVTATTDIRQWLADADREAPRQ